MSVEFAQPRQEDRETLGCRHPKTRLMWLYLGSGRDTLVYQSPDLTPAGYTILNFEAADIDKAVDALAARGVRFERCPSSTKTS
jgi:hypothetical protein